MVASGKAHFYPVLMLGFVRFFIRIYKWTLSPFLRLLCGPNSGCRFTPTCSAYFLEAVEAHGLLYGSWLGLKRLARCQPWGGSGYDPVPERKNPASSAKPLGSAFTVGAKRAE
jgi:putative membrane protein insertion efficiency factor